MRGSWCLCNAGIYTFRTLLWAANNFWFFLTVAHEKVLKEEWTEASERPEWLWVLWCIKTVNAGWPPVRYLASCSAGIQNFSILKSVFKGVILNKLLHKGYTWLHLIILRGKVKFSRMILENVFFFFLNDLLFSFCLPGCEVIRNFALLDQLCHYRRKTAELACCLFLLCKHSIFHVIALINFMPLFRGTSQIREHV